MFRRSGSLACFFIEGSMPAPLSEPFLEALQSQRFRTIEDAASEEMSCGWVTQGDPTGNSFEREDLDFDAAVWLRLRIDKKTAPTKWLQIHRLAEERAAGRRLNAKERKDLKEDLLQKLMPRVLPSINLVDALLFPQKQMVMLFATSAAVKESFLSLFYKTFGVSLLPADPFHLATRLDLPGDQAEYLHQVSPVKWPSSSPSRSLARQTAEADDGAELDEELSA